MSVVTGESGALRRATPAQLPKIPIKTALRFLLAVLILVGIGVIAYRLHNDPERGANASFSLLVGSALGIVFQRGRFCFFCITRDYIEFRNSGPLFSILTALAVGSIGYAVVFGAFLPDPSRGRLPPDAHIGPVSWVLVVAGVAFGFGMALSGACISGHLYRLGEGYTRAPLALFGSLVGFGLGFLTWQPLYIDVIVKADIYWLPEKYGYAGALAIQLGVLALLGMLLWRRLPEIPARPAQKITPRYLYEIILRNRWNPLVTGAIVGVIGIFAYLRVEPLGVTAQLGSISRTYMNEQGMLADRLNGLDGFRGCATAVVKTITDNGLFISGFAASALAVGLAGGHFKPSRLTPKNSLTALLGGGLMGWGSMLALGCTVGTLLSGISAFAASGWVFGGAVLVGIWVGVKLRVPHWAS